MTPAERRERACLRSKRWRRAHGIKPRSPAQRPWLADPKRCPACSLGTRRAPFTLGVFSLGIRAPRHPRALHLGGCGITTYCIYKSQIQINSSKISKDPTHSNSQRETAMTKNITEGARRHGALRTPRGIRKWNLSLMKTSASRTLSGTASISLRRKFFSMISI